MQAALTIRNPIARALARELAELRRVSITDAVVEALQAELARERAAAPLEDQLAALVERAKASHLFLTGDKGTTSLHGCSFDWSYDGMKLYITCTGKPFYIGCDVIGEHLDLLLAIPSVSQPTNT